VSSFVEYMLVNARDEMQGDYLNTIAKGDKPLFTYQIDHVVLKEITKKIYNQILVVVDAF